MNVSEKLDVFTRIVMTEAQERRGEMMDEAAVRVKEACDETERRERRLSEERIKKEDYKTERMKNKAFIEASQRSKKELIELRSELMEQLEANLVTKLEHFMASSGYERYVIDGVKRCAEKHGNVSVTIMAKDTAFADDIAKITGKPPALTDEDFIGGYRCVVVGKNALLDYTFASALTEEMEQFNRFKITG